MVYYAVGHFHCVILSSALISLVQFSLITENEIKYILNIKNKINK